MQAENFLYIWGKFPPRSDRLHCSPFPRCGDTPQRPRNTITRRGKPLRQRRSARLSIQKRLFPGRDHARGLPKSAGQKSKDGLRIAGQSLAILNPFPQTRCLNQIRPSRSCGPTRPYLIDPRTKKPLQRGGSFKTRWLNRIERVFGVPTEGSG